MHTITAMFHTRVEAERAADALRTDASLATTNVRVLPENDANRETNAGVDTVTGHPQETGGFMTSLRNFFMPEEDRYGYAEGLRRGSYMVAADADEAHAHQVMDVLENTGAVDLDAEEQRWRSEGWRGYEPSSAATAASGISTGGLMGGAQAATIPPVPGNMTGDVGQPSSLAGTSATTREQPTATGTTVGSRLTADEASAAPAGVAATSAGALGLADTEERIALVEEQLRVGKRVAREGRIRIRSYVVETPVTETVHLRDERVEVERRPVDRPLTANEADPFQEREIEATESREEAVIAKDVRIREELVLHKSVEERDEIVRDTVRHTEVKEERDGDTADVTGTMRNPATPDKV